MTKVPRRPRPLAAIVVHGRTSSREDGGPTTRGESRIHRDGEPTPSPTAHLAGPPGCFEVLGDPVILPAIRESTRDRAESRPRPACRDRFAICPGREGPPSSMRRFGQLLRYQPGGSPARAVGRGRGASWYHTETEPVFGPVGMRGFDRAWLPGNASRGCCSGLVNQAAKRSTWQPPVDSRSRRLGGRVSVEATSASRVVEASCSEAAIRTSVT